VKEYARTLRNVTYVDENLYTCSQDTQEKIKNAITEHKLNRVIVASCSPRTHEPMFRETIREAGLNRFLFEMANIREQVSWVTSDKEEATEKAIRLTEMAISKATQLQPLTPMKSPVEKRALVIGGGISGIQAALDISLAGYQVTLVERLPTIGGRMAQLEKTFPTLDCSA
jgi:heterodisulfide reductase subunit A